LLPNLFERNVSLHCIANKLDHVGVRTGKKILHIPWLSWYFDTIVYFCITVYLLECLGNHIRCHWYD